MMSHSRSQEGWPILSCRAKQGLLGAHWPGLHALHNRHWLTLLQPGVAGLVKELSRHFRALWIRWLRRPPCIVSISLSVSNLSSKSGPDGVLMLDGRITEE